MEVVLDDGRLKLERGVVSVSITNTPPAHLHRPHVNLWLVAVVVLAAALIGLGTWVLVDHYAAGVGATQDATTLIDSRATEDATALIDRVSTAFTTNDAAALTAYYAPNAVVRSLGLNEEEYTGIAEIQSMASGTWQVSRIAPVTVEGEFATTFVRLHAGDQSWTGVETFQIQDGKIVRQWSFALGETPPFDNAVMP